MIALPMAPAERAERLTGREYLSFSSIAMYQGCPLRWHFKYAVGLAEDTVSASLVFGGAIHRALQRHFEGLLTDDRAPDLDDLMGAYQNEWRERHQADILFGKGDTAASLQDLAARMLQVFQRSELAEPNGTILAVEEELTGEIVPGCPPFLARLDLAVETNDEVVITDFKTARSRWSSDQVEDASVQLLLYQELARSLGGNKRIKLQFGVLTKTKDPVVEIYRVVNDTQNIQRTRRIIEEVWSAIQTEHVYPAPSPTQCPSCPYRGPCRTWDG